MRPGTGGSFSRISYSTFNGAFEREAATDSFVEHDAKTVLVAGGANRPHRGPACSGDMYAGVPISEPSCVSLSSVSFQCARPK